VGVVRQQDDKRYGGAHPRGQFQLVNTRRKLTVRTYAGRQRVSAPIVTQITATPSLVTPRIPGGVQTAPSVTPWTIPPASDVGVATADVGLPDTAVVADGVNRVVGLESESSSPPQPPKKARNTIRMHASRCGVLMRRFFPHRLPIPPTVPTPISTPPGD
jgi:hypothetical protein